jgi:hypothetical protein
MNSTKTIRVITVFLLSIFLYTTIGYSAVTDKLPYVGIPHLDTASYYYNIKVKEKTNNNDGAYVAMFLRFVGLNPGYAWCAAFVSYCVSNAPDILTRIRTAVAQKCVTSETYSEKDVRLGKVKVASGDIPVWQHGNSPNGHTGIVYYWKHNEGFVVEGNSGNKVSLCKRKLEPRNYFRIKKFTRVKYRADVQMRINKIQVKSPTNVSVNYNNNFSNTR